MNTVSKPFYFGSYLAAMLLSAPLIIFPLIAGEGRFLEEYLPFTIMGSLISVYAFVVLFILIYKMWKAIPPTMARTTPGKAVGFLFIPVFNLYWWFPALWGWSQDWNSYAANSEGKLARMTEGLPLSIAVFSAIGGSIGTIASLAGAPWLGTFLSFPNYVLIPVFIFRVCDLLNSSTALPDQGIISAQPDTQKTDKRSPGVASLVLGILSIFLPYIGCIAGIIAIVMAKKQRAKFREPLSMAGFITGIIGTILWGLSIIALIITLSIA